MLFHFVNTAVSQAHYSHNAMRLDSTAYPLAGLRTNYEGDKSKRIACLTE